MLKRHHSNYSLWPEQARPRKGLPLALAAGGFAIGIVCAVAANNVISDFLRPAATAQAPAPKKPIEHTPVYAAPAVPAAPAPSADADQGETSSKSSRRPRTAAAKVTLPSIGTSSTGTSAGTDGRGGDAPMAGSSSANLNLGPQPRLLRDDAKPKGQPAAAAPAEQVKPAAQPPVLASAPEEVKPALEADQQAQPASEPRAERAAKPRKRIVRKKRERRPNSYYASPARTRPYGGPTYGYYGQPVYGGFPF